MTLPDPLPVSYATLDNGLTLLVREDRSAPVASVQAWIRTGSIHEGAWLGAGISHLLEHLLFKGTERRGVSEIARDVQAVGGHMNAYTSFDRTVYHVDGPASGWRTALDVISDQVFHSTLPEGEYEKEREVIRREMAMGEDSPGRVASQLLFSTAFRVHPQRHPVIGHRDVFDKLTRDDVFAYYRARYSPANVVFVVVGDVAFDEVRAELERLAGGLPRLAVPDVFIPSEPPQLGPRDTRREFPTDLARVHLGWHIPAIAHPDLPALELALAVLGHGRSSRLEQRLVERDELVHSIDAWCYSGVESGLAGVTLSADPARTDEALDVVAAEIARLAASPPSEAELDKIRRQAVALYLGQLETMSGQAADIGNGWFTAHNTDFLRTQTARLATVPPGEVQRVVSAYLVDTTRTRVRVAPPAAPVAITAPARPARLPGELTVARLRNDVRIVTRRNPRLPLVSVRASLMGGLTFESAANHGISRLTAETLLKGTPTRDAERLASELEDLGGSLDADTGLNSISLAADVLAGDLDRALEVMADVLLRATFPAEEVDHERDLLLAGLQAQKDQPHAVCGALLRRTLFPAGHPYALNLLGSEASLASLKRNDLVAWLDRLRVGGNLVVSVFGDVDPARATAEVERWFGSLPAGAPPRLPDVPHAAHTEALRVVEHSPKQQAIVHIGFETPGVLDPASVPLELVDDALSDMASPLFQRIREEQGLAYSVGAAQRLGLVGGQFILHAACAPDKADHVASELLDEVKRLVERGLDPADLARTKAKLIASHQMARQSNGTFAQSCALDELFGLGARRYEDHLKRLEEATPESILATCRAVFSRPPVIAIVRPDAAPDAGNP